MSTIDDLAEWFSPERAETKNDTSTSTIKGTAMSDSKFGFVDVVMGNDTLTYDDGGITVNIPTCVQVKAKDTVLILLSGGNAKEAKVIGVVGRGDETAQDIKEARDTASDAYENADAALKSASTAEKMAEEADKAVKVVGQHFWYDDNGIHVSTDEDDADGDSNLLANSEGIQLRHEDKTLTSISPSGLTIFDGEGNEAKNVLATFGQKTIIGKTEAGEVHILIDEDSFDIINGNLHIGKQSTNDASSFIFGTGTVDDEAIYGTIFGTANYVSGKYGLAHGDLSEATGDYSLASGLEAIASGPYSHSFGISSEASGSDAFASGLETKASGAHAVAFGDQTEASGYSSAAFGQKCKALGPNTFTFGQGLKIGDSDVWLSGFAVGQYNKEDTALFVVGDGWDDDYRSDAFVVYSGGDAEVKRLLKDTPQSGEGTQTGLSSAGSWCRWYRTGNVVELVYYMAPSTNINTYSKGAFLFENLPGCIDDDAGFITKIDGTTGTALVHVDTYGRLAIEARETAITANTHVLGRFVYICNDRYTYTT